MSSLEELSQKAETFLKEPILAAGVFAPTDSFLAITAGALGGSAVADLAGGGPLTEGLAGAAGIQVARSAHAQAEGLTARMLVAVTKEKIVLLDWDGVAPSRILTAFPREGTHVTVKKFGASRRVTLENTSSGQTLEMTGAVGFLSSESAGDKAVLAMLV